MVAPLQFPIGTVTIGTLEPFNGRTSVQSILQATMTPEDLRKFRDASGKLDKAAVMAELSQRWSFDAASPIMKRVVPHVGVVFTQEVGDD